MIVYRCCACTHDHTTLQIQGMGMNEPSCTRCGGTAFSQIDLPDPDAPPATPRDLPGVHSEQSEADQQAARERAAAKVRAVEGKPPGACSQVDCAEMATHRFTWPGNPECIACPKHARAAVNLSQAMGFFLEVPAL